MIQKSRTQLAFDKYKRGACGLDWLRHQMQKIEDELNKTKMVDVAGYKPDDIDHLHEYEN